MIFQHVLKMLLYIYLHTQPLQNYLNQFSIDLLVILVFRIFLCHLHKNV